MSNFSVEYCDDDREYIRPPKRAKTETFSISTNPSQPKMNIYKEYLANPANASSDVQGKHTVYWMPYRTFAELKIKMWKYNRPLDEERVKEIRQWIDESKRVDGVIYLAFIDGELVCYESNHRREALKGVEDVHNILVDILWNATDEDVKNEFQRLNKAVSVPELYVAAAPIVSEAELRPVVEKFCDRFKSHRVTSKHPQKPNFNRDMIFDQFYRLCGELPASPDELLEKVMRFNATLTNKDKSKLTPKVIAKCMESGLWIFAWSSQLCAKDLA
jgi:hypothetical protein